MQICVRDTTCFCQKPSCRYLITLESHLVYIAKVAINSTTDSFQPGSCSSSMYNARNKHTPHQQYLGYMIHSSLQALIIFRYLVNVVRTLAHVQRDR